MSDDLKLILTQLDQLNQLNQNDQGESDEAEAIRDAGDEPWKRLTKQEKEYANMYSRFLHCMSGYEYHRGGGDE